MTRFFALPCCLVALAPAFTLAAEGELEFHAQPALEVLLRHSHANVGFGGGLTVIYGVKRPGADAPLDFLAPGLSVSCGHLRALKDPDAQHSGVPVSLFYDATRCSFVPEAVFRLGSWFMPSLSLGLGYRFELHTGQSLVSPAGVLLVRPNNTEEHHLVTVARLGLDIRVWGFFVAGGFVRSVVAMVGRDPELDLAAGVAFSLIFYP